MQDNPNTENLSLDTEDWQIAFGPYSGHPDAALSLGRLLMILSHSLKSKTPDVPGTLAAIDEAAAALYSHSDFHKGAFELYRIAIEGRATRAQEALIETLGVRL